MTDFVTGVSFKEKEIYIIPTISIYRNKNDYVNWFSISTRFISFLFEVTFYFKNKK